MRSAASFAEVAKVIGNGQASGALTDKLQALGAGINRGRIDKLKLPKRADLRKRLRRVAIAAKTITDELSRVVFLSFLVREGEFNTHEIHRGLSTLKERVEAAEKLVSTRGGRDRAVPRRDGLSAREQCALVVVEAWRKVHRKAPGSNNKIATTAAEKLWVACGGTPRKPNETGRIWRTHFETVSKLPARHSARTVVRNCIAQNH